jgi:hypothetical protein
MLVTGEHRLAVCFQERVMGCCKHLPLPQQRQQRKVVRRDPEGTLYFVDIVSPRGIWVLMQVTAIYLEVKRSHSGVAGAHVVGEVPTVTYVIRSLRPVDSDTMRRNGSIQSEKTVSKPIGSLKRSSKTGLNVT